MRWRVLDDGANIHALWADAANNDHEQVTARAGWFDLDGCEHPAIMLAESTNGSTLADVAVSVQQYWASGLSRRICGMGPWALGCFALRPLSQLG